MKKLFLVAVSLVICVLVLDSQNFFNSASAQVKNRRGLENNLLNPVKDDQELAETIKRLTNRSTEGLAQKTKSDGTVSVDLQGRFQNVVVARTDFNKEPNAACIASIQEANAFFEKDLETGQLLPNYIYRKDPLAKRAADHGMSKREYLYYKQLIADAEKRRALAPNAAAINIVNNDGPGEGFNDPTAAVPEGGNMGATVGAQRLNLFNFAAGIWGAFLDSSVTTNIRSQFDPQFCNATSAVLGSAGTINVHRDFANAGFAGTWYHAALANKQAGADLVGANPEINTTFNSNLNGNPGCLGGARWYYGFDNTSPPGTINLLVVLLHEMGHGLGFSTFTNGTTGAQFFGFPDTYSTFIFDRTQDEFWNNMTNGERVASAIDEDNVLWDGPSVKIASGGLTNGRDPANGRVEIFTPNPFQGGSSVSHFNTDASPNLLMEPFINSGLPIDLDLTRQQMRDIGWYRDSTADLIPDTITTVVAGGGSPTLAVGVQVTVTWVNTGGFNRDVIVELSTDGGATYPTVLGSGVSNFSNLMSFMFTVPNMPTTMGRIRVREDSFVDPSAESAMFNIFAPTAANAGISGRVVTSTGRGISQAMITLVDSEGSVVAVRSNQFGYFSFEDIAVGQSYTIQTFAKGYSFAPQILNLDEDITGLNIIPN